LVRQQAHRFHPWQQGTDSEAAPTLPSPLGAILAASQDFDGSPWYPDLRERQDATAMGARSRSAILERAGATRAHPAGHSLRPVELRTQALMLAVKPRLADLYGARLKGLILFGSRARGDFTEGSDADVAVILEQPFPRPFAVKCEVIDATYDLFLESGLIIQPWPLCEQWLDQPQASPYPHVIHAILREGVCV
jgi:predicted nucleotidyltransferase